MDSTVGGNPVKVLINVDQNQFLAACVGLGGGTHEPSVEMLQEK